MNCENEHKIKDKEAIAFANLDPEYKYTHFFHKNSSNLPTLPTGRQAVGRRPALPRANKIDLCADATRYAIAKFLEVVYDIDIRKVLKINI